jgi:hypothetical protein
VLAQRCCKWCGETFEAERRRGGQRLYCPSCSPPGRQVVKVRGRLKLRRGFGCLGGCRGFRGLVEGGRGDPTQLEAEGWLWVLVKGR